jgi:hypothetical protein
MRRIHANWTTEQRIAANARRYAAYATRVASDPEYVLANRQRVRAYSAKMRRKNPELVRSKERERERRRCDSRNFEAAMQVLHAVLQPRTN